jgi:hypothetical protein
MKKILFLAILLAKYLFIPVTAFGQQTRTIESFVGWKSKSSVVPYPDEMMKAGIYQMTGKGFIFACPLKEDGTCQPSDIEIRVLRPDGYIDMVVPFSAIGGNFDRLKRPIDPNPGPDGRIYYLEPIPVSFIQGWYGSNRVVVYDIILK